MVFELRMMKKKKKKKKKKKEDEERRITKSKFSSLFFSASELCSKILGTFLTIVWQRLFVCKCFCSLGCGYHRAAPIP